jgi:hypothetical protein
VCEDGKATMMGILSEKGGGGKPEVNCRTLKSLSLSFYTHTHTHTHTEKKE